MTFIRSTRMSPTLSFRIRTNRDQGEAMLYCRLRYDGMLTTEYKIYVTVPIEIWPDLPDSHPQSAGIKLQLAQVRADHQWLCLNLPSPTADSIKNAWLGNRVNRGKAAPKSPTLLETYQTYLDYLTTPPKRKSANWRAPADKTITNRAVVGKHFADFLHHNKLKELRLDALKTSHGYRFSDYLFDLGISANTVARYISYLSNSIDYAMRYDDRIEVNPLASVKIKGDPPKRIDYLSELDLIRLAALPLDGILDTVRNWSLLMCYTGLDHNDALVITKKLGKYYRQGTHGDTIVFQRLKYDHAPQWGECHIPVTPMTRELLSDVMNWKRVRLKVINTHIKKIGPMLNLDFVLHSKIFRKTAAIVLLLEYEDIYLVQKALGHQSLTTTQRYYLDMPPEVVHNAMKKKQNSLT